MKGPRMSLGTRYNINYWHVLPIPFIKPISGNWPAPPPEPRGAITILPVGFGRNYHLHSQNSLSAAEGLTVCVVFKMWLFGVTSQLGVSCRRQPGKAHTTSEEAHTTSFHNPSADNNSLDLRRGVWGMWGGMASMKILVLHSEPSPL